MNDSDRESRFGIVYSPDEKDTSMPDGMANKKILQVNSNNQNEPPVIFEYYTEYGHEGVTIIHIEGDSMAVPNYAIIVFASYLNKEINKLNSQLST